METSDLFVRQSLVGGGLLGHALVCQHSPSPARGSRTQPSTWPSTWVGSGVQQNVGSCLCVLLERWGRTHGLCSARGHRACAVCVCMLSLFYVPSSDSWTPLCFWLLISQALGPWGGQVKEDGFPCAVEVQTRCF